MKRTRRWLLMLSAVVGLMAHAGALRPPSLRSKTTTTASTTTTTEAPPSSTTETVEETPSADTSSANTTGKTLTGIPQIDYIWDPNLPRELNGYNLSEYPFLSTVPEKIDFKCGDLHDGFYASTKYKCQIYHHCIYGIRHDFLCANYTAFDQRTFICHFVSEVDCKNSDKYFFRNDALYKATTTTTSSTTTTTTVAPPAPPPGKRRRPLRRRRPVDYYYDEEYDDYFEERMNRRQKNRPRPRRPEYDDEYEEDVYEKRPQNRERKRGGSADDSNYDRRPAERPADRAAERPVERPVERPAERPLDRPRHRARPSDSRRYNDEEEEDRYTPPRKPGKRRRPIDDFEDDDKEVVSTGGRRFSSNDRRPPNPKVADEDLEEVRRPLGGRKRKGGRRPLPEDEEDEIIDRPSQRSHIDDEPLPKDRKEETVETAVRTSGPGSIFKTPRKPPRIAPPVPINERKKFEYPAGKKSSTTPAPRFDDEYYDDYEDDVRPAKKAPRKEEKFAEAASSRDRDLDSDYEEDIRPAKKAPKTENKYAEGGSTRDRDRDRVRDRERNFRKPVELDSPVAVREDPKTRYETVESTAGLDDYEDVPVKSSRYRPTQERGSFRHSGGHEGYEKVQKRKPIIDSAPLKPIKNYNDAIPETEYEPEIQHKLSDLHYDEPKSEAIDKNRENSKPIVRVIKRPFLPSRGGSPYLPRGLQVVGAAQKPLPTESTPIDMGSTVSGVRLLEHGPPILRANTDPDDYPPQRKGPRTTQPPQIDQERAALEKLYESEYDVTLNDALNPTLKPVVRGLPSGFTNPHTFGNRFASIDSSPYTYQDSLYSPTDSRRRSVQSPVAATRSSQSRQETAFYDYDY